MGRVCYRRRLAEGSDAPTGARLQCDFRQGDRSVEKGEATAKLPGLGRNALVERNGVLSVYPLHQSPAGPEGCPRSDPGDGNREGPSTAPSGSAAIPSVV